MTFWRVIIEILFFYFYFIEYRKFNKNLQEAPFSLELADFYVHFVYTLHFVRYNALLLTLRMVCFLFTLQQLKHYGFRLFIKSIYDIGKSCAFVLIFIGNGMMVLFK